MLYDFFMWFFFSGSRAIQQSPRKTGGLCGQTCLPPENAPAFARRCVFDAIHGKGKWQIVRNIPKHRSEGVETWTTYQVGNRDWKGLSSTGIPDAWLQHQVTNKSGTGSTSSIMNYIKYIKINRWDNFRNQTCQWNAGRAFKVPGWSVRVQNGCHSRWVNGSRYCTSEPIAGLSIWSLLPMRGSRQFGIGVDIESHRKS